MQNQLENFLLQIQKTLLPYQRSINRGLLIAAISLAVFWILAGISVFFIPKQTLLLMQISGKLGTISLFLFVLTLFPGIITRLHLNQRSLTIIATLLTPYRRQLGILMFITALLHMSFSTTLPKIAFELIPVGNLSDLSFVEKFQLASKAFPPSLRLFEQVGMVAWVILLPVWLTSNDFSQKFLGRKWKSLQRLTYLALWFIFSHVAMQSQPVAVLLLLVGLLEIYSWVLVWRRKQK